MPVLTFRASVPNGTSARSPVTLNLLSGASALHSFMIWTANANATLDKCGYRIANRLGALIVPDIGARDSFTFGNAEDGWAPIPPNPQQIMMSDQVIEGPPYLLQLQFYNIDAAAILVGGYFIMREPMARLAESAMIYEFLTSRAERVEDVSPETKTPLLTEKKSKVDLSKAKVDVKAFFKDKPMFQVEKK